MQLRGNKQGTTATTKRFENENPSAQKSSVFLFYLQKLDVGSATEDSTPFRGAEQVKPVPQNTMVSAPPGHLIKCTTLRMKKKNLGKRKRRSELLT